MHMGCEKEYRGENTFLSMRKSGRASRDEWERQIGKRAGVAQFVGTWSSEREILKARLLCLEMYVIK